jgi:hypothetical protein
MVYLGKYLGKKAVIAIIPVVERETASGLPLQGLALSVNAIDGSGELARLVIPVPDGRHPDTEMVYPASLVVTGGSVHLLFTEKDVYWQDGDVLRTGTTKTWLMVASKSDITQFEIFDAGHIGSEARAPITANTGGLYLAFSRRAENRYAVAKTVAMDNDEALHFWADTDMVNLQGIGGSYLDSLMCIKTAASGASVLFNSKDDLPAIHIPVEQIDGIANTLYFGFLINMMVNSVVYLGSGVVLAKCAFPTQTEGLTQKVEFIRSTDGGLTWGRVVPTGFASDMVDSE